MSSRGVLPAFMREQPIHAVFRAEPFDPEDSDQGGVAELRAMRDDDGLNIIMTPHVAGSTLESCAPCDRSTPDGVCVNCLQARDCFFLPECD